MIPGFWFERGIGDLGQSLGVTATGLLLIKVADPDGKTPAMEAFGYEQLGFEPCFGGGLVTAASVPLIAQFGPVPLLVVMAVVMAVALGVGLLHFGRRSPAPAGSRRDAG
jgi:glutamate:Na+ symporter, ESS family